MIRRSLPPAPTQYLSEVSDAGLADFRLRQYAEADTRRKECRDVLEEWVRAEALALLAEYIRAMRKVLPILIAHPPGPNRRPCPPELAAELAAAD